jgi:ABC-type molybdate transport system substrate-binding protein
VKARQLAGDAADVAVASTGVLNALADAGKILAATRTPLGRSRQVVVMRKGAVAPALTAVEDFSRALLEADAISYNEGSSGEHAVRVIDKLGLRDALAPKITVAKNGAEMMAFIVSHPGFAVGLAQFTNLLDHMSLGVAVEAAGSFPDSIQDATRYEAAVSAASRVPSDAAALVRSFASAQSKKLLEATGLEQESML